MKVLYDPNKPRYYWYDKNMSNEELMSVLLIKLEALRTLRVHVSYSGCVVNVSKELEEITETLKIMLDKQN